jgi:hypothetical protein
MLGAHSKELGLMMLNIKPGTPLFLLNMQSNMLWGTFVATGKPDLDLVPKAFDGKFAAHIKVAALPGQPLRTAKLERRIPSGWKSQKGIEFLLKQLEKGENAPLHIQQAWTPDAVFEEEEAAAAEPAPDASEPSTGSAEPPLPPPPLPPMPAIEEAAAPAGPAHSLKVPICDKGLRALIPEARRDLEQDLLKLKEESGVIIEFLCSPEMEEDNLLLKADSEEELNKTREWLHSILPFYDVDISES